MPTLDMLTSVMFNFNINSCKDEFVLTLYTIVGIMYGYMICLLLAGATKTACHIPETKLYRSYEMGYNIFNSWNGYLNTAIIVIIQLLYDKRGNYIFKWLKRYGRPVIYLSEKVVLLCNA